MLIHDKCISQDPKLGTYIVIGSGGKPHVVRIFPSEFCSCPSTSECYHIMAVKMSLGIPHEKRKKVNLTQLRLNTRSNNQKKTSRKRPRPGRYVDQLKIIQYVMLIMLQVTIILLLLQTP